LRLKSVRNQKNSRYLRGLIAEYAACLLLFLKGYALLRHRFKNPKGEVDIVARKGRTIIAVEVKARRQMQQADFAINEYQWRRIERGIWDYVSHNKKYSDFDIRFDAILLSGFQIKHIKNAWSG